MSAAGEDCLPLAEAVAAMPGGAVFHLLDDGHAPRPDPAFIFGTPDPGALPHFRGDTYLPKAEVYVGREIHVDGPWFDIGALLTRDLASMICDEIALDPRRDVARARFERTRLSLAAAQRRFRRVPGRSLLLATNGHFGYGHWLVDFLPKLYFCELAGIALDSLKILLPTNMHGFGLEFLRLLGFGEWQVFPYNPDTDVLVTEELVIPTVPRWGGRCSTLFGPAVEWLNRRIADRNHVPDSPFGPRIFVKRPETAPHKLLANRDRFEALAVAAGFEIFEPERFGVLEQIAAFRAARQILGEYGSTLHNTIFSRPGVVLGAVHLPLPETFDALQSGIGERLDQTTGYIFAENHAPAGEPRHLLVDEAAVRACLAEMA